MSSHGTKRDIAERIFFRSFQCDSLIKKTASQAIQEFGLSSHQWIVLGALSYPEAGQGNTVGDLAQLLRVSRQSLTPTISRLEADGYIERVRSELDARAKVVRLTPAGADLWEATQASMGEFFDQALQGFSFDDLVTALHIFNRLLENLTSYEPPFSE